MANRIYIMWPAIVRPCLTRNPILFSGGGAKVTACREILRKPEGAVLTSGR
jgi:hypothetical protein